MANTWTTPKDKKGRKNIYTGRIVRDLEKRDSTVFPAMNFCVVCNCYYQDKCKTHSDRSFRFTRNGYMDFSSPYPNLDDQILDGFVFDHEKIMEALYKLWMGTAGIIIEPKDMRISDNNIC